MHAPGEKIGGAPVVTVRQMSPSDVSAALTILEESPEASIWSRESLLESASQGIAWAADVDGCVAGILIGTSILMLLPNLTNMWGVPSTLETVVIGGALLLGAILDEVLRPRRTI